MNKNSNSGFGCLAIILLSVGVLYFCQPSEWRVPNAKPSVERQVKRIPKSRQETIQTLKIFKDKGKAIYLRLQKGENPEVLLAEALALESDFASIRPELREITTLPGTSTKHHGEDMVEIVHAGLLAISAFVSYKIEPPENGDDSLEVLEKEVKDLLLETYYMKIEE